VKNFDSTPCLGGGEKKGNWGGEQGFGGWGKKKSREVLERRWIEHCARQVANMRKEKRTGQGFSKEQDGRKNVKRLPEKPNRGSNKA